VSDRPPPATPGNEGEPDSVPDADSRDSAETNGDESSASEKQGGGGRVSRLALWVSIIGGILGAVVAASTLYLLVFPNGGGSGSSCGGLSGTLDDITIDEDITYRDFLRTTNQQDPSADEETLARHGTVIGVTVSAVGFVGRELPLRWTTFTGAGHLTEEHLTDQLALGILPEACRDTIRRKLWAPSPKKEGAYFVELTLLDDRDGVLTTARTPRFNVPGL
jgi:hypothetical protein